MAIVLILIFILIIAAFTIIGFNKGFLRTLVSMSGIIIGIIFVALFSNAVTNWVDNNTPLRATVREAAYEKLSAKAEAEYAETAEEGEEALSGGFVPESILKAVSSTKEAALMAADKYVSDLADTIAGNAVEAAGVILTILLSIIVTRVVLLVSKVISHIPIIGGVNRIFGGVLGFVRGGIILCIIFLVITMFQYTTLGQSLLETIVNNKALSFMYETALTIKSFFI